MIAELNVRVLEVLKDVKWPDIEKDTVLNVWIMRQAPNVSSMSLECDWPREIFDAQGDNAAEEPLKAPEITQKLRKCIPSDMTGISFRVKILAGGSLDKDPVFHTEMYQWKKIND